MTGESLLSDPHSYYVDLRSKAGGLGSSPGAHLLTHLTVDPARANPVSIIQVGLGALQTRDPARLPLVAEVAAWIQQTVDDAGRLAYRFAMPHTFPLDPPWYSSLAQGEAISFLVRAARVLDRSELFELATQTARPLVDLDSPLIALTPDGPVLQEYPTDPPSHVLNGWLFSLWGLYDLAHSGRSTGGIVAEAADAFAAGAAALAARIDRYRTGLGWSLYDLYPHPLPNVASPFYHRLHVEQLQRQQELHPDPRMAAVAADWERAAHAAVPLALAVTRKAAFRVRRPRWYRVSPTA